ncbi:GIY-YIG nuclease family protein [Cereibacter changlensis]|uniref:GIY-YIG nuclease family protein n=1 Tax=Cereibacter changlensis TaxID=402884 RepID=UPI004033D97B
MASYGRSLEFFFVDGRPEGILTAEVFNWTGHILKVPRTRITEGLARREASFTGVYLLLGDLDGKACAYVGEGEDVAARIKAHDVAKDWWTDVVIVTTSANNLHKAHIKFLESRIVELARNAGNMALENGNTPPRSSLSEAARSNMEEFLDTLRIVLPALGIDLITSKKRAAIPAPESVVPVPAAEFRLEFLKENIVALAGLQDGEFVVRKGSLARRAWIGSGDHTAGYRKLHSQLIESAVLMVNDQHAVFTTDYAFASPSAAAAVVLGRSANGRVEWRLPNGIMYRDWEAAQLSDA